MKLPLSFLYVIEFLCQIFFCDKTFKSAVRTYISSHALCLCVISCYYCRGCWLSLSLIIYSIPSLISPFRKSRRIVRRFTGIKFQSHRIIYPQYLSTLRKLSCSRHPYHHHQACWWAWRKITRKENQKQITMTLLYDKL